ncbi:MAG: uncharacterized protein JWM11_7704 [Planctomycetaceae bacterium]|nr:uncharacterized protein [Planctomycetaceae bacterium]
MKKATDNLPIVENSNKGLGLRSDATLGPTDVDLDANEIVILNGHGMSVAPAWRKLPAFLIPERLISNCGKARGDNDLFCFTMGTGAFENGVVTDGLYLNKDKPHHGCIVPSRPMHLTEFELHIQQTRPQWTVDEE